MNAAPKLDRDILQNNEWNSYRLASVSLVIAIILISSFIIGLSIRPIDGNESLVGDGTSAARTISYTTHAPITLLTEGAVNSSNNATTGISWGDGSAADPYIILGWEIYAKWGTHAIEIGNFKNKYLWIMDCRAYNASNNDIYIHFSSNITVIGNNCSLSGSTGIFVWMCDHPILTDNTCYSNSLQGIYISYSKHITVEGNNCTGNIDAGLYVAWSSNITFSDNLFSSNPVGVLFSNSENCSLANNNCSKNTGYAVSIDVGSKYNRLWNNTFYHNDGTGNTYDSLNSQVYDRGTKNRWNTSGLSYNFGNYWRDMISPDTAAPFGIVDNPYKIGGGLGYKDYYPLTNVPIPPAIPEPPLMVLAIIMAALFIVIRRKGQN